MARRRTSLPGIEGEMEVGMKMDGNPNYPNLYPLNGVI
jgi:hypothetical protein